MTTGMIALAATLMAGVSLLTLGLVRARRRPVMVAAVPEGMAGAVGVPMGVPVAEELAARVEGLIAEQTRAQTDALASLRADIQHLKSDVEWLAGERMIEQAIALAQSGAEPDEIGRELGLTRETAEAISTFRKH